MTDDNIGKLVVEIGKARLEFDELVKSAEGLIGNRSFNYVPLGDMVKATEKALAKYGIGFVMPMSTEGDRVVCSLEVHGHGASIVTSMSAPIPRAEDPGRGGKALGDTWIQELGRVTTYLRRYLFNSFWGLDTVEDKDGQTAEERPMRQRDERAETPAQRERKEAPKTGKDLPSEDEVKERFKRARAVLGWSGDEVRKFVADQYGSELGDLTRLQRFDLVVKMESLAEVREAQEEPGASG